MAIAKSIFDTKERLIFKTESFPQLTTAKLFFLGFAITNTSDNRMRELTLQVTILYRLGLFVPPQQ